MSLTRPSGARQYRLPHRSSESFDAIPLSVQQRTDVVGNAKRLYGALSSAQRMDWAPSYAELAERLGSSPRSIIRWVQQLAEAGLIVVKRRGQGLIGKLAQDVGALCYSNLSDGDVVQPEPGREI